LSASHIRPNQNNMAFLQVKLTMKKLILMLSLVFPAAFGYAQAYKTVKIDSLVSISLPAVYTEKDTLGQQTFTARASYGFIVVTRIPNATNNTPLKKEKDLKKVFKSYVKDVAQVGNGSIQNERDTTVGKLKGHLFSLRTDDGSGGNVQVRKFLFLYTQDVSYTFQYLYDDIRSDLIKGDVKNYYGSIKLSPELQRNDQYLIASGGKTGLFGISPIVLYGGGITIILIAIFVVMKRKRNSVSA
jgi:hypothetical protein